MVLPQKATQPQGSHGSVSLSAAAPRMSPRGRACLISCVSSTQPIARHRGQLWSHLKEQMD